MLFDVEFTSTKEELYGVAAVVTVSGYVCCISTACGLSMDCRCCCLLFLIVISVCVFSPVCVRDPMCIAFLFFCLLLGCFLFFGTGPK